MEEALLEVSNAIEESEAMTRNFLKRFLCLQHLVLFVLCNTEDRRTGRNNVIRDEEVDGRRMHGSGIQ